MAITRHAIVAGMLVLQVTCSIAEESDGRTYDHPSRSDLWVEAYSQEWTLRADGSTISCNMKGTGGRVIVLVLMQVTYAISLSPSDLNLCVCLCVLCGGVRISVLWGKSAGSPITVCYKSLLNNFNVQRIKQDSIVVTGMGGSPSQTSLDTAGGELKFNTYLEGDVQFLKTFFESDDWTRHSLHVRYEIENAVCVQPGNMSSAQGRGQGIGGFQHEFHAPWANWWKVPVKAISYSFILPAPAGMWSQDSPMITTPPTSAEAVTSATDPVSAGRVVHHSFTAAELGIGLGEAEPLIFAWSLTQENHQQNWHGAQNYEGKSPELRQCLSAQEGSSCRVCVFILWPFLFALPLIVCMIVYSVCVRRCRPAPRLDDLGGRDLAEIRLQGVVVNADPRMVRGQGMLAEQIEALPTTREPPANGDVCGICLEPQCDTPWRLLPCGHRFHTSCVDEWLAGTGGCPTCRSNPCEVPKADAQPLP